MILLGYSAFVVFGAILVPLILVALLLWERYRAGQVEFAVSEGAPYEVRLRARLALTMHQRVPPRGLRWSDVGVCSPISLLTLPVLSVAGLWLTQDVGDLLLTFSSIPCVLFWLKLRESNVLGAEVYALSTWILAYAVWFGGLVVIELFGVGPMSPGSSFIGFPPSMGALHFASVAYGVIGVAVAMLFVRWAPNSPFAMIVLLGWIPLGIAVWSFVFFGPVHLALAVMLAGYAISRDVRRRTDDVAGLPTGAWRHVGRGDWFRNLGAQRTTASTMLALAMLAAFLVVGAWTIAGFASLPWAGVGDSVLSWQFLYVQVVTVAAVALVAGVVAWKAGALFRYGAMLIGIGWPLLLSLALVPHRQFTESEPDLVGWIPVPFVMLLVLYVMWRVFGPGVVDSWADEGAGGGRT